MLGDKSLETLLPESISSTPAVSIQTSDTLADAATLLPHHLETFTDSLVVTQDDLPVGIVGGIEILDGILKNQTPRYLDTTTLAGTMSKSLVIIDAKDKFATLVERWSKTRRAFAITPNKYHGYSAISARKILEIGTRYDITTKISQIPRKKTVTFFKEETVNQIISRMFENHTRKLVLEGTSNFINDRIIIQKLVREFDCLRDGRDFLKMRADIFSLDTAKKVQDDITISSACKMMQEMESPYLIRDDGILSPWDMVLILASEKISMK